MHRKDRKPLDVIANDSDEDSQQESVKVPDMNDYYIHTDLEITSSDDKNFSDSEDNKSSLSRTASFFRGGSRVSCKSDEKSEINNSHRSFMGRMSEFFHRDRKKRLNSASSSLSNKGTQRANFLTDEYDKDYKYSPNLIESLDKDSNESYISSARFEMNSIEGMNPMIKETPLTPITNDIKIASELNNHVRNSNSNNYYSTQLTDTYSNFYNFYESLNIGTLSKENNTDLNSLMRQIKIMWDNNQIKINTLQEENLDLVQKIDSLKTENSKIQAQFEQSVQSQTKLANKYKQYVDILDILLDICNKEACPNEDPSNIHKTIKNPDFNKLVEIVKNGPTWRKHSIQLQQENQDLKENNRQLTTEIKNSKDQLEDKVYKSVKSQFERKMNKLEECIEEHKEKSDLLEQRNLETINKYKNEKQKVANIRNEIQLLTTKVQLLDCQKNESLQFMSQFMNSFSNYVDKDIVFDYNILLESLISKLNLGFLLQFDDGISETHFQKIETQLHQFYQEIAVGKFMDQMISRFIRTEGTNNILNNNLETLGQQCDDQKKYIDDLRYYVKRLKKRLKEHERLNFNNVPVQ